MLTLSTFYGKGRRGRSGQKSDTFIHNKIRPTDFSTVSSRKRHNFFENGSPSLVYRDSKQEILDLTIVVSHMWRGVKAFFNILKLPKNQYSPKSMVFKIIGAVALIIIFRSLNLPVLIPSLWSMCLEILKLGLEHPYQVAIDIFNVLACIIMHLILKHRLSNGGPLGVTKSNYWGGALVVNSGLLLLGLILDGLETAVFILLNAPFVILVLVVIYGAFRKTKSPPPSPPSYWTMKDPGVFSSAENKGGRTKPSTQFRSRTRTM